MYKKTLLLFIISVLCFGSVSRADEGMWLPLLIDRLNYVDMQKMGLHLTAEEIYSVNHNSLKDAIIQFGTGCTGSIISSEGLVLTNHHCGFGQLQAHSTVQQDFITNGFWAMSKAEELPNDGLTATFLVRIEDVSQQILSQLTDKMTETERNAKIEENFASIKAKAQEGNNYEAVVKSFFDGNEFYLFVYEIYRDVRLVGAPPLSIGDFGGDTDNWMWPRHTGDFSLFRIYSGPDGKPADYSKNNIPLKPKYSLPISIKGVKENDFAMMMGYPGTTDRFLTSYGVKLALDQINPAIVKIRDKKLLLMKVDMNADDEVRIKYASKYNSTSNYWKYYIGQSKNLKRLKTYEKNKAMEKTFTDWVNADPGRIKKYGEALTDIATAYNSLTKYLKVKYYFSEAFFRGCEVISFANKFEKLYNELIAQQPNEEKIRGFIKTLNDYVPKYFKDYNSETDKKLFGAMLKLFYEDITTDQLPDIYVFIEKKYKGDQTKFVNDVFSKSIFVNPQKALAFLDKPNYKDLDKDLGFKTMQSVYAKYREILKITASTNELLGKGNRLYVAGLREMLPDKKFYPNANSTMRMTYGKVLNYFPADAIRYDYYTNLDGVMEKEDPDNPEFIVPDKLKELYKNKDYGRWGEDGELKVCFLTNNDITGGNSGSPIINGDGQIIGLTFDGNWEAMSNAIAFEPKLQRAINVDVRYILFIIDKYAGAKNIIEELNIIDKNTVIPKKEIDKG